MPLLRRRLRFCLLLATFVALGVGCSSSDGRTVGVGDGKHHDAGPGGHDDADGGELDASEPVSHDDASSQPVDDAAVPQDASVTPHANSWSKDCTVFDPDIVYVHGALAGGGSGSAIAEPAHPTHVCPGFVAVTHLGVRPSDGAIITASEPFTFESDAVPMAVRVQVADPFVFDSDAMHFVSPEDAWQNDHALATSCPDHPGAMSFDQILMTPSGQTSFTCSGNNYLFPGNEAAPDYDVVAHGDAGHILVRTRIKPIKHGLWHDDVFTPLDMQWGLIEYAARARSGGGFWLAIANKITNVAEQVTVDDDGKAHVVGQYADAPAPYSNASAAVLDAQGRLWQIGGSDSTPYAVFYRPLQPEAAKVVYSMDDADPDMTIRPPRAFVDLDGAVLFTGP